MDSKLRLLFAMSALPACGPGVADDPRVPDGGDPGKFVRSCVAVYSSLYACYEESYPGAYGTEGASPDYLRDLCREYRDVLEQDEGTACLAASEEVFACLASLDCTELLSGDFDGPVQPACTDVYRDAAAKCPAVFSPCAVETVSGGVGCSLSVSACLDGGTYAIECTEAASEAGPRTCACQRDGAAVATVTLPEAQACGDASFAAWAESACAFPDGVFRAFGSDGD